MRTKIIFTLLLTVSCSACTTLHQSFNDKPTHQLSNKTKASLKTIYVVHYSWHSGVIIKKSDIPTQLIPEKADFPYAQFLEIGWGNKAFYQAKEFKLDVALKALFVPGSSTMYMYGFYNQPENEYLNAQMTRLYFSSNHFHKLLQTIHNSFNRKQKKRAPVTLTLTDRDGRFYDALGFYSIGNTCNIWTAKVLKSGGVSISTSMYSMSATCITPRA